MHPRHKPKRETKGTSAQPSEEMSGTAPLKNATGFTANTSWVVEGEKIKIKLEYQQPINGVR